MSFTKRIEFGNYTLKFGEEKVLLDFAKQIVEPSFESQRYLRKIKDKGEYFFLDTQLVRLSSPHRLDTVAITGRIVKNTKIKRDQIFKSGGIVLGMVCTTPAKAKVSD